MHRGHRGHDVCAMPYVLALQYQVPVASIARVIMISTIVSLATVSQSMRPDFRNPSIIIAWLFAAIGANICYFAAPIVEAYACWLGVKGRWITTILFVLGVLISIPLVAVFGLGPAGMLLPPQL